ncbi:hypothetical protein [Rickettsiella endosymbiont of Dermanyssus gallinae]|uniref:hypothetical protein n=1 Tax=Rickettsiella endosymbiont of Dermanyssus gallinae TaxID=2856608 RepID=UPI001C527A4A|nr:hypothetical protein [Rickettsiella endosymbiont of Dermanyssus gallinae]
MAYTREEFGKELKQHVSNKEAIESIGYWTYSIYLAHIQDIDNEFRAILLTLNMMEDDPQFAYSYEELNKIADDLIAGKEVKL